MPDFGAFAGYRWGGNGSGFEWGLEAGIYANVENVAPIVGGNLQLSVKRLDSPTLVASITGGSLALGGELGLAYRFGEDSGMGLHFGAFAQLVGNVAFRYKAGIDDLSLNLGARFPSGLWPMFTNAMHGRPLRTKTGLAGPAAINTDNEPRFSSYFEGRDADSMEALWLFKAQAEWLSVPAFAQLAHQLKKLHAPQGFIARTLQAKNEEIKHSVLTAGIASMASGKSISIAESQESSRPPLTGKEGLTRVAIESWLDGCLHEGLAAKEVTLQAEQASEPHIREALIQIAEDESRHHELAWDILDWALQQGGPELREALKAVRDSLPHFDPASLETNEELQGLGALSLGHRNTLYEKHVSTSRQRLNNLLEAQ